MKVILLICLLLVLAALPVESLADEFSGYTLQKAWEWYPGMDGAAYKLNYVRLKVDSPEGAMQNAQSDTGAKMLRTAPEGDYMLEVHAFNAKGKSPDTLHGLMIYTDSAHWLALGFRDDHVIARGVLDGQDTGEIVRGGRSKALRICRDTRSDSCARYLFYASDQGNEFTYLGDWTDSSGRLDHARVGLVSVSGSAMYEYFQLSQLELEQDEFTGTVLDGQWTPIDGTDYAVKNKLFLASSHAGTGGLLRTPLHEDYVIYAYLEAPAEGQKAGLLVWKDAENHLFFGSTWNQRTVAKGYLQGEEIHLFEHSADSDVLFLQIEKQKDTYTLRSSTDGFRWQNEMEWTDEDQLLLGARYGLGVIGENRTVIRKFRELAAPNGVIRQTNNFRCMGALFGGPEDGGMNDTFTPYAFRTGDLGSLLDDDDRIYMMMGDSFSGYGAGSSDWRSNVLAVLEPPADPESPIRIQSMITKEDNPNFAKQTIHADHTEFGNLTTIPTGGVKVGDRIYWIYDSISQWCKGAHLDSEYAGWAWSDDQGQTFTRVDKFFMPEEEMLFCYPYHQDGYVYLFGSNGKNSGPKLARVPDNAILDRSQYVFYAGLDEQGGPIWIAESQDAKVLFDGFVTEFCVSYNSDLKCYIMGYLEQHSRTLVLRDAPSLWGPWSNAVLLSASEIIGQNVYTPSTLNRWQSRDGMYFFLTYYTDYVCKWCHVDLITE